MEKLQEALDRSQGRVTKIVAKSFAPEALENESQLSLEAKSTCRTLWEVPKHLLFQGGTYPVLPLPHLLFEVIITICSGNRPITGLWGLNRDFQSLQLREWKPNFQNSSLDALIFFHWTFIYPLSPCAHPLFSEYVCVMGVVRELWRRKNEGKCGYIKIFI